MTVTTVFIEYGWMMHWKWYFPVEPREREVVIRDRDRLDFGLARLLAGDRCGRDHAGAHGKRQGPDRSRHPMVAR
ncbi:MAG TPA: hypothetical protein VGF81_13415 [Solirubrobacteraceae bacterium]